MTHKIDLSVVLNAHCEANMMQATLNSIARSLAYLQPHRYSYELIIVLDASDEATRDYISYARSSILRTVKEVTVIEVSNKDLGQSRNDGVVRARGLYTAVVDADDIYTEPYFHNALQKLKTIQNDKVIVHPGFVISFDKHDEVWCPIDSKDVSPQSLVQYNMWPSQAIARTAVFRELPYASTKVGSGFGPEDWHWNAETLSRGYRHIPAKNVVYFYRRKNFGSLAAAHDTTKALLPISDFLNPAGYDQAAHAFNYKETYLTANTQLPPHLKRPVKEFMLSMLRVAVLAPYKITKPLYKAHHRLTKFDVELHRALHELTRPPQLPPDQVVQNSLVFPEWLIAEWKELHQFDHKIFPTHKRVHEMAEYKPTPWMYTRIYWELAQQIGMGVDYLFVLPWLKTGGGDLVALNYVKAILEVKPSARVVVLGTEVADSPWKDLLPSEVKFISLDEDFYSTLSLEDQTRLLGTLIVQLAPKRLHLINSALGYRLFTEYSKPLSKNTKLFISAFSVDVSPEGMREHYLLDHLKHSAPYISKVLTDNKAIVDQLVQRFGFNANLFSVHYQPANPPGVAEHEKLQCKILQENNLKVLWAARLDRAKRADILERIAQECLAHNIAVEFHIYGSAVLDVDYTLERMVRLSNVVYEGPFNRGLWQLPLDKFDLFMMTSQWEGMPNAPLQAIAGGLPVMAPRVGGIPEIISAETGYLIDAFDDVQEYVKQIKKISKDRADLNKKHKAATNLLKKRHTWEGFKSTLIQEAGYME